MRFMHLHNLTLQWHLLNSSTLSAPDHYYLFIYCPMCCGKESYLRIWILGTFTMRNCAQTHRKSLEKKRKRNAVISAHTNASPEWKIAMEIA